MIKVGIKHIDEDCTTDYSHWITNVVADTNVAKEQMNQLKASNDWKGFKILPGVPKGNETITSDTLTKMGIIGIYAVSDEPIMRDYIKKLREKKEEDFKKFLDNIDKLETRSKAWEILKT